MIIPKIIQFLKSNLNNRKDKLKSINKLKQIKFYI